MTYPNFESFTHLQAFKIANHALAIVKERNYRRIGVRVTFDNKLVFQYLMDGKNEDVYLRGKEKLTLETTQSTDYVFNHKEDYTSFLNNPDYCVAGGSVPIYVQGECRGAISISGMTSEADHALALEVLEAELNQVSTK